MRPERAEAWSGGRFRLYSPAFAPPAWPGVVVDGEYLSQFRQDDTTFVVSLPDRPGETVIDVRFPDDTVRVGPITLRGFRDAWLGPPLKGTPRVWPGPPRVVLVGPDGLVQYDLRRNVITQSWPDSVHAPNCGFSPGPSFRGPDYFVLQARGTATSPCGPVASWRFWPSLMQVDSSPIAFAWVTVELAPDRWLRTTDDRYWVYDCPNGVCADIRMGLANSEQPVLSPRGDRLALPGSSPSGPLVLDGTTGDSVFAISFLHEVYDAEFSEDGDTLFLTGTRDLSKPRLVVAAVRASDGAVLDSVTTAQNLRWPAAITPDPIADLLYVAGVEATDTLPPLPNGRLQYVLQPTLLVLERSTLVQIAALRVPVAADPLGGRASGELAIIPSPADGAVYVLFAPLIYDAPTSPSPVYRFDRVP